MKVPERSRPRRRARAVAGLALSLTAAFAGVAACTPANQPTGESNVRAIRELAPAPLQSAALHDAEEVLIRDCMRERGFDYWVVPAPTASVDDLFPYVIDDDIWAEQHGFGPSIEASSTAADRPNTRYVHKLPPSRQAEYFAAIDGAPGDPTVTVPLPNGAGAIGHSTAGCTAMAEERLYGDFETWFRARTLAEFLASLIHAAVVKDPSYVDAEAVWARCMRGAGYAYASVPEARAAFLATGRIRPDEAELRVAVWEASCAHATDLAEVARRIDHAFRIGLPSEYQAALAAYESLWHAALIRTSATSRSG